MCVPPDRWERDLATKAGEESGGVSDMVSGSLVQTELSPLGSGFIRLKLRGGTSCVEASTERKEPSGECLFTIQEGNKEVGKPLLSGSKGGIRFSQSGRVLGGQLGIQGSGAGSRVRG